MSKRTQPSHGSPAHGGGWRWAFAGGLLGGLFALVAFAPAQWLAQGINSLSKGYVLVVDPQGTVWNGSGVVVLTAGRGSREASALPGRMHWALKPISSGLELRLRQACCLNDTLTLRVNPGWSRTEINLLPPASGQWVGQWPSAWLAGLGTPWNTLQLEGPIRLHSSGLTLETVQKRLIVKGQAEIELLNISSRLATRRPLGSYRLSMTGEGGPSGGSNLNLLLSTTTGALQLNGIGTWGAGGLHFQGEATTLPDDMAALQNLLNVIGRRDGARSVISIG